MSLVGNVVRYPVAALMVEGFRADSKKLDEANKELHERISLPETVNGLIREIKKDLPESLGFAASPIAKTMTFIGKKSLIEIGGAVGAVFGGLGFAYGSSPGSWFREKARVFSDYMYEKTKPVFHWGGATLGAVGIFSIGSGYFLKKSPEKSVQKADKE